VKAECAYAKKKIDAAERVVQVCEEIVN